MQGISIGLITGDTRSLGYDLYEEELAHFLVVHALGYHLGAYFSTATPHFMGN